MTQPSALGFSKLAKEASMQPKEALLEIKRPKQSLFIGVPKETTLQEARVPLTPSSVHIIVNNGNEVWIESNAGKIAKFSDKDYSEAGAKICYSKEEVFKANIIVKVEPPTEEELVLLKPEQLLLSAIQQGSRSEQFVRELMNKNVNAMAFEYLKGDDGTYPIIRSMSEIAGITALSLASELLASTSGGKGEMLGGITGIPPTEVVIIGAGTVGEFAARTALGNGASVKIFDNSITKLRRLQYNLNLPVFTSLLHPKILNKALLSADVSIGCMRGGEGRCPLIVGENIVRQMKEHSVIIDISIDQGGNFETSELTNHLHPTIIKHGITHYCVPNITSRVCRTASYALSNIISPLLLKLSEEASIKEFLYHNPMIRNGMYVYKGNLTNRFIGQRLNIISKDIDLLLAAQM